MQLRAFQLELCRVWMTRIPAVGYMCHQARRHSSLCGRLGHNKGGSTGSQVVAGQLHSESGLRHLNRLAGFGIVNFSRLPRMQSKTIAKS